MLAGSGCLLVGRPADIRVAAHVGVLAMAHGSGLRLKALYQHLGIGQNDLEKRRVYSILKEMKLRIVIKYILVYFF